MKTHFKSLLATLILSFTVDANTDVMSIVNKANLHTFYQATDGKAQARMIITDAQGRRQIRQFSFIRKDQQDGGDQDILMLFSKPSDIKGTLFRVAKHINTGDDRWLYLPALDLVKRISAGDKRTSFVGSHFFYEDISGRNINDDNFTLLSQNDAEYLLQVIPKDPTAVEFTSYQVVINKASFLPTKIEYTNKKGQLYRRIEALKIVKIQGYDTVVKSQASDLINGGHTIMQFRQVSYDNAIPQAVFSERSLRTPPKKWLK